MPRQISSVFGSSGRASPSEEVGRAPSRVLSLRRLNETTDLPNNAMAGADQNPEAGGEPGLMQRVQQGDVGAFELVVERHWLGTLRYVCHLCEDPQRAYELTQDAFSRLWRKREDWTGSGSVRVWLLRTARNMVISDRRKWKVRALGALKLAQEQKAVRTPLEDVEALELQAAINRAVWKLSARRREAFVLVHLQGLSYREVSGIMGVRPQTVANYLQAAIADLRILLSDHMPQHLPHDEQRAADDQGAHG